MGLGDVGQFGVKHASKSEQVVAFRLPLRQTEG